MYRYCTVLYRLRLKLELELAWMPSPRDCVLIINKKEIRVQYCSMVCVRALWCVVGGATFKPCFSEGMAIATATMACFQVDMAATIHIAITIHIAVVSFEKRYAERRETRCERTVCTTEMGWKRGARGRKGRRSERHADI